MVLVYAWSAIDSSLGKTTLSSSFGGNNTSYDDSDVDSGVLYTL